MYCPTISANQAEPVSKDQFAVGLRLFNHGMPSCPPTLPIRLPSPNGSGPSESRLCSYIRAGQAIVSFPIPIHLHLKVRESYGNRFAGWNRIPNIILIVQVSPTHEIRYLYIYNCQLIFHGVQLAKPPCQVSMIQHLQI